MPILCESDINHRTLNFPRPFVDRPRLAHGLRQIDIGNNANIRVTSALKNISKSSADCHITTWYDTILHNAVEDVLALAPGDVEYLTGEHTRDRVGNADAPASVRIDFERPFVTPPKVVVFLNSIDLDKKFNWRITTTATDVDTKGFTLNIETWSDTVLFTVRAGWIAYPEDREHIFSKSVTTMDLHPPNQPQQKNSSEIRFDTIDFSKKPTVFVALNTLDISCKANLRINAYVDDISTNRLTWHIDTWADTILHAAGATIIAFD